ncbi:MAG: type IVB secretion system apparatus protein IcmL/DotI [Alphaproteobacteria bacterium]|nr:type IVB secretion system apparatus protein IcmL/DotI [Alphaproteobacteria bacterium]
MKTNLKLKSLYHAKAPQGLKSSLDNFWSRGRNALYRAGYKGVLRLAVTEAMVILFLIAILLFIIKFHNPEDRYFATTEDGHLLPMQSLTEPNLSMRALTSWSAQAATEVMTFGFNNYQYRLQESSRNFTEEGWQSFSSALERSKIITNVVKNQQLISAAPAQTPIVVAEGLYQERYQWQVQVPLVITYQAGSAISQSYMLVTMLIVRVPNMNSSNGIGIQQWVAQ